MSVEQRSQALAPGEHAVPHGLVKRRRRDRISGKRLPEGGVNLHAPGLDVGLEDALSSFGISVGDRDLWLWWWE